jgi:hypothetical protein
MVVVVYACPKKPLVSRQLRKQKKNIHLRPKRRVNRRLGHPMPLGGAMVVVVVVVVV